jgi:hypothetical protein
MITVPIQSNFLIANSSYFSYLRAGAIGARSIIGAE